MGRRVLRVGAYPGTFDPPTIAHLAIAEAALDQGGLDAVSLVLSRFPLAKTPTVPRFEDRLAVLAAVCSSRPWLSVAVTDARLIADVCAGYDAVVMGADKWLQVLDPAWYPSASARDAAVASLPSVLLAARPGSTFVGPVPSGVTLLSLHDDHGPVSSSLVRSRDRLDWMLPEAAAFDASTGAWTDPDRYLRESLS